MMINNIMVTGCRIVASTAMLRRSMEYLRIAGTADEYWPAADGPTYIMWWQATYIMWWQAYFIAPDDM
jgi:poly(3-hydroxybutyrate) depolymerase